MTAVRLIRRAEVQRRTGLPTSTLYFKMARGEFPKPVKLGAKSVAWIEAEVEAWVERQIAARGKDAE